MPPDAHFYNYIYLLFMSSSPPLSVSPIQSTMAGAKRVRVKLLVDKEKKRVVFAESDNDFVDVLFSFLTLPLGTIVRLLGKQSNLGCMDKLYERVEKLDGRDLQTEACRAMLLRPRNAAAVLCEDLNINVDDSETRKVYVCKKSDCCAKATCFGSSVKNTRCPHCQQFMCRVKKSPKKDARNVDGVFVKRGRRFMISDDLSVMPASLSHSFSLFDKLGIEDGSVLEERTMDLGKEEVINLLRRTLVSKMPLTDICFETDDTPDEFDIRELIRPKSEDGADSTEQKKNINVKLSLCKATKKVVFLEAGQDFVDFLLSFLTFPLGTVVKLLSTNTTIGCVDNLYMSAELLNACDYLKSDECRCTLLSPKLAPFLNCSTQLLKIIEQTTQGGTTSGCYTCYWENEETACSTKTCKHRVVRAEFKELNPKMLEGSTKAGGGFVIGPGKFMVMDDLCLGLLSPVSAIQTVRNLEMPLSRLDEKEVVVDETQALDLLKAALVSQSALTHVFCPSRKRSRVSSKVY